MTQIAVDSLIVYSVVDATLAAGLRPPNGIQGEPGAATQTVIYTPDLTAGEQTTFDQTLAALRSKTGLSATDYAAVRAQMQILRDLRQLGRNAFVAQTQAQINRQLYDATIAITQVLLALLRDP